MCLRSKNGCFLFPYLDKEYHAKNRVETLLILPESINTYRFGLLDIGRILSNQLNLTSMKCNSITVN